MVEHQRDAELLQVSGSAVGETPPVRYVTGDVVGDAADAEVRVSVGNQQADSNLAVELEAAPGGLDPGVASPDDRYVHGGALSFRRCGL